MRGGRVLRNLGLWRWGWGVLLRRPDACWVGVAWERRATWLELDIGVLPCLTPRLHVSGLRRVGGER